MHMNVRKSREGRMPVATTAILWERFPTAILRLHPRQRPTQSRNDPLPQRLTHPWSTPSAASRSHPRRRANEDEKRGIHRTAAR